METLAHRYTHERSFRHCPNFVRGLTELNVCMSASKTKSRTRVFVHILLQKELNETHDSFSPTWRMSCRAHASSSSVPQVRRINGISHGLIVCGIKTRTVEAESKEWGFLYLHIIKNVPMNLFRTSTASCRGSMFTGAIGKAIAEYKTAPVYEA